jgi:hypothetical protein
LFYLNRGGNKVQIGSDLGLGIGTIFVGGSELSLFAFSKGVRMKTADYETGFNVNNNGTEFVDSSDSEKKIIIPYGTTIPENFFLNSGTYLSTIPKYLFTYSNTGSPISTLSSLFNFFNDGENSLAGIHVFAKDNTDFLLALNKNDNSAQLGSCNNFENEVNVGGKNLNLYGQDYISIRHAISNKTYCQFGCGSNNIHFTNQSDNIKK